MTPDEIEEANARWKSDIEKKIDRLLTFHETYGPLLLMLSKREERWVKIQDAIIEKSIRMMLWTGLVGLAALVWAGIKAEWSDAQALWNTRK